MRGRNPREIVTLLSSRIPENRIVIDESLTLSQWISLCKNRLGGKILFVVFSSITYPKIDVFEKLADMEPLYTTL